MSSKVSCKFDYQSKPQEDKSSLVLVKSRFDEVDKMELDEMTAWKKNMALT
jgi:hypothetical protein